MTEPDSLAEYLTRGLPSADAIEWINTHLADPPPPIVARKLTAYFATTHELLVDNDPSHVCGPDCPPEPPPPPPLPWHTRSRYALRRARRRLARLGGLRLVHKDRIDQDD